MAQQPSTSGPLAPWRAPRVSAFSPPQSTPIQTSVNTYSLRVRVNYWGELGTPHCSVSLHSGSKFISPGCHFFQLYYGSMIREVHSVERNQAAHTLRSLTHPKLPVAESATGKTCARVQMFIFPSLPPSIHGVGGTVAGAVGRGRSCPIHLYPKSAAPVMTPLHLHGLNSHPSNFSLSVDLVKMKIEIRN